MKEISNYPDYHTVFRVISGIVHIKLEAYSRAINHFLQAVLVGPPLDSPKLEIATAKDVATYAGICALAVNIWWVRVEGEGDGLFFIPFFAGACSLALGINSQIPSEQANYCIDGAPISPKNIES